MQMMQTGATSAILAANFGVVAASMPVFLVSATAPLLEADLGFSEVDLGVAVAVFFAGSSLAGVPGGRLAERLDASRMLSGLSLVGALLLMLVAAIASEPIHFQVFLLVCGVLHGSMQPLTNLVLARTAVPRPALMFAIKQSAPPMATLISGISVSSLTLAFGWRATFATWASLVLVVALLLSRVPLGRASVGEQASDRDLPIRTMWRMALVIALATASATCLISFLVVTAVDAGLSVSTAGGLLALSSIIAILVRVLVGWTDNFGMGGMRLMALMLLTGALGHLAISTGVPILVVAGAIVGYAAGWGWPGLLMHAVVRLNPQAPAAASGVIQVGGAAGAMLGPFAFALTAARWSLGVAWLLVAVLASASAVSVVRVRQHVVRDLEVIRR